MTRRALALTLAILVSACALVTGLDDYRIGDPSTPSTTDSGVSPSDGGITTDAITNGVADASVQGDSAEVPNCASSRTVDPLTSLDASSWIVVHDLSNGDYPKVEATAEGAALSLIAPDAGMSLGGIWLQPPVEIRAFDLSFRYSMTCPSATGCSDGIAVAWIAATDAGASALMTNVSTSTFGLPAGAVGGAALFDVHTDSNTGDGVTPSVTLARLDGRTPGGYDWHIDAGAASPVALLGAHDVMIRVRSGLAEVRVDGALVTKASVPTDFTGWFGLTASTGLELGAFVIRSFDLRVYVCDAP
jgi:hypothetical protein